MILDNTFVWLWMYPEMSHCQTYVILGRFLHRNDPILQSMLQIYQLGITNVADEIMIM